MEANEFDRAFEWWHKWIGMLPITLTKRKGRYLRVVGIILFLPWVMVVLAMSAPLILAFAIGALIKDAYAE
jgi:hypothetical protein